jgi:hypothetical protein
MLKILCFVCGNQFNNAGPKPPRCVKRLNSPAIEKRDPFFPLSWVQLASVRATDYSRKEPRRLYCFWLCDLIEFEFQVLRTKFSNDDWPTQKLSGHHSLAKIRRQGSGPSNQPLRMISWHFLRPFARCRRFDGFLDID